jgi:cyanophycinase
MLGGVPKLPGPGSRGLLALIGGSEDRHNGHGLLARIVSDSRAASVAIIPAASAVQEELDRDYCQAFGDLGVAEVFPLVIGSRGEADSQGNVEKVGRADLVFFTGGSQIRLLESLEGTKLAGAIMARHMAGAAVAGTSAGSAAAGEWTIYHGDGHGTEKEACGWRRGFGFLPGMVVDTHFMERGRIYRLAQFLASGTCRLGIGVPEDTAILVRPDGVMEAAGSGVVTVMDAGHLTSNNFDGVDRGCQVTVNGIRAGFLPPGARFDLHKWEVAG